jgi:adenylosuccinate lyase
MVAIWSPEERFRIWFEIEALAAEAMAGLGTIPAAAAHDIRHKGAPRAASIDAAAVEAIDAIERVTRHDVIAFLTWMGEGIGENARFMHQGMTSSDVLDTAFAVQLTRAADLLIEGIEALLAALRARALEHKYTPTIGRSHAIHAEPTTFGLKLAGHYAEFARNLTRLRAARAEIATCAISGPVGTFASVDPRVEAFVAKKLGLTVEPVSTQVIPRDRHAAFFATLGVIASSIERLSVEIRHLQRTEVREAEEAFGKGQKGSSAMPHKRNPITAERITGLARVIRANSLPAMEDVALWHERDISHSSVERVILPDSYTLLDYLLATTTRLIEGLVIRPERMQQVLDSSYGLVFSQRVLLGLVAEGLTREEAYAAVQRNAMTAWDTGQQLQDLLAKDDDVVGKIDPSRLDAMFDPSHHLRHLDEVFERVEAL